MKARNLFALVLFVLLATANSGGYRYGIGDQAFYQPATLLRLHPELFPRDRALIESQAKLTVVDEALAAASRVTRLEPPQLFFVLYLITLAAMFAASAQLASVIGLSPLATAVFLTLLTLRHRIAKTGANTLEGYMHPRQLAFALGIFALTAAFKRRWVWMSVCWLVASIVHPTTAVWWAAAIGAHLIVTTPARQRWLAGVTLAAVVAGPLVANAVGLARMDDEWVRVLDNKDYLFASGWPMYAWVFNLAYLPLIVWLARVKGDARLIAPSLALFAAFAISYPLTERHVALAVQTQVSRVFWLMDFFLALLVAWLLIDSPFATARAGFRKAVVAALLIFSAARGVYTVQDGGAERAIVRVGFPADDWTEAMDWLSAQPSDWLVLAHPDHAWLYGTSVRVAASRDVVVESVKDSAISMYDRDVAMRTAARLAALSSYDAMDAHALRSVGTELGATVAVTTREHDLNLPMLHRNATFAIYDLR